MLNSGTSVISSYEIELLCTIFQRKYDSQIINYKINIIIIIFINAKVHTFKVVIVINFSEIFYNERW